MKGLLQALKKRYTSGRRCFAGAFMEYHFSSLFVIALAAAIHFTQIRKQTRQVQGLLHWSFVLHFAGALLNQWIYYSYYPRGGDLLVYHDYALPIIDAMGSDFFTFAPQIVRLGLQLPFELPFEITGTGSTGTMQALTVGVEYLFGGSGVASGLLISFASHFSKWLVADALAPLGEDRHKKMRFAAILLVPSFVIWSTVMLKEAWVIAALGPALWSLRRIQQHRTRLLAALALIPSSALILLLKPHIFLCLSAAAGVWMFFSSRPRSNTTAPLRLGRVMLALIVLGGGSMVARAFLPNSQDGSLAQSIAQTRRAAAFSTGGSNFALEAAEGTDGESDNVSFSSQASLFPLAIFTALFRPLIFEVSSALQVFNALETTVFLFLFIWVLYRSGFRRTVSAVMQEPSLAFCLVFVLTVALGTGLSTSNLGTLSRYRSPMTPFFLLLLLSLYRMARTVRAPAPASLKTDRLNAG
jgi:hypothetical protein